MGQSREESGRERERDSETLGVCCGSLNLAACLACHALAFGTLYPAYSSYKAVKTKNVKEYVKWMMYWIVFALFTTVETLTDLFMSWFPFYFELKIAFEIDEYITQAKDRSYETMMRFGKRGLNLAATAAVTAASKHAGPDSDQRRGGDGPALL
ncbi:unnamed protein product [Coregonus sp. 'balchen']|nr:unnamed protein product [Coregonus sp. 'balchen']